MKKKLLSLLLVFAMMVSLLPTVALADSPSQEAMVTVDFTAQAEGAFLCAPQFEVEVSGNLAESYEYQDEIAPADGVSALDVLVKAHETVFGEDFSTDVESYLAVSDEGYIETIFGVETGNCGFTIDRGFPNGGTESEYGGYNGYAITQAPVEEGALVEFFLYQDSSAMDTYTYLTVPGTAAVGETFTVNVSGLCYGWNGYKYATPAAMIAAAEPVEGISIGVVDEDGAVTDLEQVTDEDGDVTISFDQAGTYMLAACGTDASDVPVIMTLATVTVGGSQEPLEEVAISAHSAIFKAVEMYSYDNGTVGTVDYLSGESRDSSNYYHVSVPAGDYQLVGTYNNANEDTMGTLVITVEEDATNTFDLFTCYSIKCSNSGWVSDTDYTMQVSVTDQQRNPRTFTTGMVAGQVSVICLKGDTVELTVTPTEARPDYLPATSSETLTYNTSMSVSCPQAVDVTFTVPAGSTLDMGTLKNYYVYTFMDMPQPTENDDGTLCYTVRIPKSTTYFYRVQNPDGVTYWNYKSWSAGETIAITEDDLYIGDDSFNKDTVIDDFSKNIYDRADIYLNINGAGYMNMAVDDTFELNSFRNWFAIESFMNAKVALPDMHYQVIDSDGTPSDVVTITPDTHNSNVAVMTANKPGTAIVLVTYDAMTHMVGMTNTNSQQFSAIWPECTGVFVVTVEADGTDIETNMVLNRLDGTAGVIDAEHDILFYVGDEGASYTFTPETGTTVTVDRSVVTDSMTFGGFTNTGVTVDEETGAVTVSGLTTGRHIIKVEKGDVANYQVITARQVSYEVQDADGNPLTAESEVRAGDTIKVQFTGLINPKEKLSGAYNFNASLYYVGEEGTAFRSNPGGGFGVYDFSGNPVRQVISITIPKYWAEDTYTLDGVIKMGGFAGVPTHRGITYAKGTNPGFDAPNVSSILCTLPQLTIYLAETEFIGGKLEFIDSNSNPVARTALAVTLTDSEGNTLQVAEDGSFSCLPGTYNYIISGQGYRYKTGSFSVDQNDVSVTKQISLVNSSANAWDGKTETEPAKDKDGVFLIATGAELAWFSAKNQENAQDIAGKLTADIDLADYPWNNTLTYASQTTSLDGDGHMVSGLNATRGLFGALGGSSQIRNLTICGSVSGGGAVTGYACGSGVVIENCVNEAVINSTGNTVGGIAGYATTGCVIRQCVNTGAVTGGSNVGGIIGGFVGAATVEECYNTGAVTGSSNVGGVFGNGNYAVTIKSCYNTGAVSGTSNIGGVGGALTGPSYGSGTAALSDCYSVGSVTGTTNVGGLLGSFDSSKASVTRGYYLTTAAENDPIGEVLDGTAMKSAELAPETFAPTCDSYPALKWQTDVTFHVPASEAESVLAPTCTEKGYSTYRCTECEGIFFKDYIAPLDHDFCEHEGVPENCEDCVYTAPGCETEGSIVHTCRRDGCEVKKTDVIPATGHTPIDSSIQLYPAYKTYTCEVCDGENIVEWNDARLAYMTMPEADATVNMTDTGSYPWTWNSTEQRLQSSNVNVDSSTSTSSIVFTLDHGGALKFDYAVSSEANYDKLTIKLNDETLVNAISGSNTGSIDKALAAGNYTLTMSFSKDSGYADGSDMGWISGVEITALSEEEAANAADQAAAAPVIEAINAIGEVTLEKEQAITAARAAYNALTDVQKALVTNESTLTAAEAKLANLKNPGTAPGEDDKITVTFRLIGSTKASADVQLSEGESGYNGAKYVTWIKTTSYTLDEDSTVGDLFALALDDAELRYEGLEGNYISSITAPAVCGGYTLAEMDNGPNSGWMYTVNGEHPNRGLNEWTLFNGDKVVWHYVNDWAYEVADWHNDPDYPTLGDGTLYDKWLDAPDVNPTSGSNAGGSAMDAADQMAAGKVADLITEIGTVTKDSGAKIEAARAAYDKLTAAQKALVENYDELVAAESAYAQITLCVPFTDVKGTDYFYDAVKWAVDKGITNGTSDTTFSPNAGCTRAQMVTFLWRAAGSPEPAGRTNPFTDVNEDAYYFKALLWAVENGITNGTSATTFSPDAVCTRGQMVTFLYRDAGSPAVSGTASFTDVKDGDYFSDAVTWAAAEGITVGTSATTFSPDADCTRSQMVTFLYRYLAD